MNANLSASEMRRRYPIDVQNKKNEWIAIEKHKKEINDEISRNENEIKRLKQKELLTELDKKVLMQL